MALLSIDQCRICPNGMPGPAFFLFHIPYKRLTACYILARSFIFDILPEACTEYHGCRYDLLEGGGGGAARRCKNLNRFKFLASVLSLYYYYFVYFHLFSVDLLL
jgi:hypothetical protein